MPQTLFKKVFFILIWLTQFQMFSNFIAFLLIGISKDVFKGANHQINLFPVKRKYLTEKLAYTQLRPNTAHI